MVAASKIRTQVVKAYNRRERLESTLVSFFLLGGDFSRNLI